MDWVHSVANSLRPDEDTCVARCYTKHFLRAGPDVALDLDSIDPELFTERRKWSNVWAAFHISRRSGPEELRWHIPQARAPNAIDCPRFGVDSTPLGDRRYWITSLYIGCGAQI